MYIPKHFEQNDRQKILAFMRAYNFALIVSASDDVPVATHLPFVIEERGSDIVLVSHMGKANEQWKTFKGKEVLVVFSEPHAYISPSLYEKKQNVPTWNYVAVHAYGKIDFIDDPQQQFDLLEKMMAAFDEAYLEQWKTLDVSYKENLRRGIVAFEMKIETLQGKEKLSQNKSDADRQNVKKHLSESDEEMKRDLSKMMKE